MIANLDRLTDAQILADLSAKHGSDKTRYCPIYEIYLSKSRHKQLNLFEIGVGGYDDPKAGGASLRMWEEYLPNTNIFALDFYDKQAHAADRIKIYKGSQDDEAVLMQIASDIGRIDIILDDGSHINSHIIKSFEVLFPLLASGGVYIVEDVGTSYWPDFGGSTSFGDEKTAMGYFKRLSDGINHIHMKHGYKPITCEVDVRFIHFWENIIIIGKI